MTLPESSTSRRWVIWQSKLDASALVEFPRGTKPLPDDPDWERVEVIEMGDLYTPRQAQALLNYGQLEGSPYSVADIEADLRAAGKWPE